MTPEAFHSRKPFAAAFISFFTSPLVGMMYLNRGKLALRYLVLEITITVVPFLLAHYQLISADPRAVWIKLTLLVAAIGAYHSFHLAKQYTTENARWFSRWYNIALVIYVIPLGLAFVFRTFFCEPFHYAGTTMSPAIMAGDHFFINKIAYMGTATPQHGDIIAFRSQDGGDGRTYTRIKRIVAVPGDTIQEMNNALFVNGAKYKDVLTMNSTGVHAALYQIKPGYYYAMGDSNGVNTQGQNNVALEIPIESILGKVTYIFWNEKTYKISFHKPEYLVE